MSKLTAITIAAAAAVTALALAPDAALVSAQPLAPDARGDRETAPPAAKHPQCVQVRPQAVYRNFGYDHDIEVENTCTKAMSCSVMTDIITNPTTVTLAPGAKQTVTTLRGSSAREFKADVSCKEAA